jgi:hypothetical protein
MFLIFLLDDWDIDHTAPIRGLFHGRPQLARSNQSSSGGNVSSSDGQGRVKYSGTGGLGRVAQPSSRVCS